MKRKILLISIIASSIVSCTTAYKTGQTPDDVYFSPVPVYKDYVRTENKEDNTVYNNGVYNNEDREIRRRINNRRYRRYDDRYNYPYDYNNGYGKYPVYTDVKTNTNTSSRKYNLDVYKNNPNTTNSNTNTDPKLGGQQNSNNTAPVRRFDNATTNGTGVGNFIRKVLSGTGNEGSTNSSTNSGYSNTNNTTKSSSSNDGKTSNNSSSSNSSGTNSSSNVPVRKF